MSLINRAWTKPSQIKNCSQSKCFHVIRVFSFKFSDFQ